MLAIVAGLVVRTGVSGEALLVLVTFAFTSLVFPVATTWGTFLHAAGPVHVLLVIAVLPSWPYSRGWGYYPSGGLGLVLLVLLVLLLLGYF